MAEYDRPCANPACGHVRRLHVSLDHGGPHMGDCAASGCKCPAYLDRLEADPVNLRLVDDAPAYDAAATHCNASAELSPSAVDLFGQIRYLVAQSAARTARLERLIRDGVDISVGSPDHRAPGWREAVLKELEP